ncbi:MAG: PEP-CTERM sorting domain-containing protein [Deltaproteobacteria bacterium]|nr:PEP-CTERM sorting domain-containing protein [Deltaproteobacteria bacterium]
MRLHLSRHYQPFRIIGNWVRGQVVPEPSTLLLLGSGLIGLGYFVRKRMKR